MNEVVWSASGPKGRSASGATAIAAINAYGLKHGRRGTVTLSKCHREGGMLYYVFGSPSTRNAYSYVYAWALSAR